MIHSITVRCGTERRTYAGTGPAIPTIDADSALEVLTLAEAGRLPQNTSDKLVRAAVVSLYREHGVELAEDSDPFDDFEGMPEHSFDEINWALTRARCGDLEDASIHLARGLSGFPEAIQALELIRAGLRT